MCFPLSAGIGPGGGLLQAGNKSYLEVIQRNALVWACEPVDGAGAFPLCDSETQGALSFSKARKKFCWGGNCTHALDYVFGIWVPDIVRHPNEVFSRHKTGHCFYSVRTVCRENGRRKYSHEVDRGAVFSAKKSYFHFHPPFSAGYRPARFL